MAKRPAKPGAPRSLRFDLDIPDPELRKKVFCSISQYRLACSQLYAGLLLGQVAGANLEVNDEQGTVRLMPDEPNAKAALAAALGAATPGVLLGYEMRDYFLKHLYPTAKPFVWDSARRDVETIWKSRDPEVPNCSRGYLAMQQSRDVAKFARRGIGMPQLTAAPVFSDHRVTLKLWDTAIDVVECRLPTLDSGTWRVLAKIRDREPGWTMGTVYLTDRFERSNRSGRKIRFLRMVATHQKPLTQTNVDPSLLLEVTWADQIRNWMTLAGPDGARTVDFIHADALVAYLTEQKIRREVYEARKGACGNPKAPWGYRRGWQAVQDTLTGLTRIRTRRCADYSHVFARRVIDRAISWRCGRIKLNTPPADLLMGHPWDWTQQFGHIAYKAREHGIEVELPPKKRDRKNQEGV